MARPSGPELTLRTESYVTDGHPLQTLDLLHDPEAGSADTLWIM